MSFTVGRCRVTVGYLFLAMIALMFALDRTGAAPIGFACAALHEAAHILAMKRAGELPQEIKFTAFGIDLVRPCRLNRSYSREVWISLAGPAANLAAALLCRAIFRERYPLFLMVNLLLFGLNILPVRPLDGGQALLSVLSSRLDAGKADHIVLAVSFIVLVPLAAAGFLLLIRSGWNFTLLLAACYLTALLLMKREH